MLFIYPGPGPSRPIRYLRRAHRQIDLNTYELTSRAMKRALVVAQRRGIRVRILLERAPYRGSRVARREAEWCYRYRMHCRWAPSRFRFDHAKYFIAGRWSWIGTMNFTYDGLNKNREAAFVSRSPAIRRALRTVFNADWHGRFAGMAPRRALVVSPRSRTAIMGLIGDTRGLVDIETEEMGYVSRLTPLLRSLGRRLRVVVPKRLSYHDRAVVCALAAAGAEVRQLRRPYPHIKLIATNRYAFIGSENFSYTSLMENREVGIILRRPAYVLRLRVMFNQDFHRAQPIRCPNAYRRHYFEH